MAMKASLSLAAPPPSSSLSFGCSSRKSLLAARTLSTSFLSCGSFKMQTSNVTLKCSRHGGALGSWMNLFDHFARILKTFYASAILRLMKDPGRILEEAILELDKHLKNMTEATIQVLVSQKLLQNKYEAAQQQSDKWYRKAQLALSKGDDELACETLKRRKFYADDAASLKAQLDQQKSVVDNLVLNSKLLERKVHEARLKKDTLKARAQSAKIATKVIDLLRNVNMDSALSAFEKMEEKVLTMELQAESLYQLTIDDLEGKFDMLEGSSVYDDLAKLKTETSGSSLAILEAESNLVVENRHYHLPPAALCHFPAERGSLTPSTGQMAESRRKRKNQRLLKKGRSRNLLVQRRKP